jgi:VanZ family protein
MISFLLSVRQSIRFILVLIYVGCIILLSLLPPQDFPKVELFPNVDKVVHFLMYLGFSVLGCWALKTELNRSRVWIIIPVTIGWGIFMEIMQLCMHIGRSFSWFDILANSIGVFTGIIFYLIVTRKTVL